MGAILFLYRGLLRPDKSGLRVIEESPISSGNCRTGLHEIGDDGLPQGDTAIVTGYLPVRKGLETAAF